MRYVCDVEDASLVEAIRAGDEHAWRTLVTRHSDLVFCVARAVLNDDAAASDAMQVTWLKLLENIDGVRNPAAIRGWLATTARREAIALSTKAGRQAPTEEVTHFAGHHGPTVGAAEQPSDDPFEAAATEETRRVLLAELDRLSDKCRQLLTLYAHKFSYAEIAELLDMAPGGVSPARSRCLEELRRSPRIAQLERSSDE